MYRITRGISIDPAPAYPNPSLRFPDGAPIPIDAGEEPAPDPAKTKAENATGKAGPDADPAS